MPQRNSPPNIDIFLSLSLADVVLEGGSCRHDSTQLVWLTRVQVGILNWPWRSIIKSRQSIINFSVLSPRFIQVASACQEERLFRYMPNAVAKLVPLFCDPLCCSYLILTCKIQGSIRGAETRCRRWPFTKMLRYTSNSYGLIHYQIACFVYFCVTSTRI
jgi:hypothetical protein